MQTTALLARHSVQKRNKQTLSSWLSFLVRAHEKRVGAPAMPYLVRYIDAKWLICNHVAAIQELLPPTKAAPRGLFF